MKSNIITNAILGVVVGDAVGVPYEFKSADEMKENPCRDMIGYGTYNQPPGTWSDDSSLMLCLADSLRGDYDLADMASKFIAWKAAEIWTPHGRVFDIGITTSKAIEDLKNILNRKDYEALTLLKYSGDEYDNGNGSLMRIIPLLFYIKDFKIDKQFEIIKDVAALTHRHIRGAMCCLIYLRLAQHLIEGLDKAMAYDKMRKEILEFWESMSFAEAEQKHFIKIIQNDICETAYEDLKSGGYVMESIEASLWCLMKTDSYKEAILAAINKGHDTDTTAAITGGLAGLCYGLENIPEHWVKQIVKLEEITALCDDLYNKYFDLNV